MSLAAAIAAIDELTGRLERALAADDLAGCNALLDERAAALRGLADALATATPQQKAAAAGDLERIGARDAALRARVGAALERLREELNRLEGSPRHRPGSEPGDLDRRA